MRKRQKATRNDITGQPIRTTWNSNEYRDNYDRIFGNGKAKEIQKPKRNAEGD